MDYSGKSSKFLYDYLALGKPVVSTSLSDLVDLNNVILITNNSDDFIEKIKVVVSSSEEPVLVNLRKSVVQRYSWKNIVRKVTEILFNEGGIL